MSISIRVPTEFYPLILCSLSLIMWTGTDCGLLTDCGFPHIYIPGPFCQLITQRIFTGYRLGDVKGQSHCVGLCSSVSRQKKRCIRGKIEEGGRALKSCYRSDPCETGREGSEVEQEKSKGAEEF